MQRRDFLFGVVAVGVAARVAPINWEDWLEDWNRWHFREELRRLANERGHVAKMCVLDPPRNGFRHVVMYTERGETVSWEQRWI